MSEQNTEQDQIIREYECGYLLVPSIPDEKIGEEADGIKKILIDNGAEIANEKQPERMELAYTMTLAHEGKRTHFNEASFGWVTFESSSDQVNAMKDALRGNDSVLRFMIIKASKDQESGTDEEDIMEGDEETDQPAVTEDKNTEPATTEASIDEGIDKIVAEGEDKPQS